MSRITPLLLVAFLFSIPTLAQPIAPIIVDSNTVALWHLDEAEGGVVLDSSPHHNDGTAFGTTIVPGQFGNERSFNGHSDYVDVSNPGDGSLNFDTNQSFTLEAWFKTTSAAGQRIFRKS